MHVPGHSGVGTEVSHLRLSCRLDGSIRDWRAVPEGSQLDKLLREKLAIIQEAQVSAVSAGFAAASNLQLLRRNVLL